MTRFADAGVRGSDGQAARVAVITFDEPEFEPSFAGTANAGKEPFSWLFFTGRCRFSHIRRNLLRRGNRMRGAAYLAAAVVYSLRSLLFRSETVFEALARQGVRATFFGVFALIDDPRSRSTYLPAFRAILDAGHELALHGYRHGPLSEADLERSLQLAREHLGAELTTYSSPFGDDRIETLRLLERAGFAGMRVWDRALLQGDSPVRRFAYGYRLNGMDVSGDEPVVLNLHSGDCYPWGLGRVKRTIARLRRRGYRFMTFAELCEGWPARQDAQAA
jgi:hypothetical protein